MNNYKIREAINYLKSKPGFENSKFYGETYGISLDNSGDINIQLDQNNSIFVLTINNPKSKLYSDEAMVYADRLKLLAEIIDTMNDIISNVTTASNSDRHVNPDLIDEAIATGNLELLGL
jgi:hypothetical protein